MTVTPDRPSILYEGTQFTLTCVIVLNTAVDTSDSVVVTPTWSNSEGVLSDGRITPSDAQETAEFTYMSTLTFMPLSLSDTNYICLVNISSASQFIRSADNMDIIEITVEGTCEYL